MAAYALSELMSKCPTVKFPLPASLALPCQCSPTATPQISPRESSADTEPAHRHCNFSNTIRVTASTEVGCGSLHIPRVQDKQVKGSETKS